MQRCPTYTAKGTRLGSPRIRVASRGSREERRQRSSSDGKFIRLPLIESYGMTLGEGTIWLAWVTLVSNLVADTYAKAKRWGARCPIFPGFRRNSPLKEAHRKDKAKEP